ncbi:cutinase family protein, partial [Mycobacterium sp. 94-17]|nr:cutinase family protein [Mycobacterium sp. 94-17]
MGTFDGMIARHMVFSVGSAVLAASGVAVSALSTSVIPTASAQCPDVQV